jgi:hypothetical protein
MTRCCSMLMRCALTPDQKLPCMRRLRVHFAPSRGPSSSLPPSPRERGAPKSEASHCAAAPAGNGHRRRAGSDHPVPAPTSTAGKAHASRPSTGAAASAGGYTQGAQRPRTAKQARNGHGLPMRPAHRRAAHARRRRRLEAPTGGPSAATQSGRLAAAAGDAEHRAHLRGAVPDRGDTARLGVARARVRQRGVHQLIGFSEGGGNPGGRGGERLEGLGG